MANNLKPRMLKCGSIKTLRGSGDPSLPSHPTVFLLALNTTFVPLRITAQKYAAALATKFTDSRGPKPIGNEA